MKIFRVSQKSYIRTAVLLVTLAALVLFCGRKALGLWAGTTAKTSDPYLFGLNMATTFPALLLMLVTLAGLLVGWYIVVELLTKVEVSDKGLCVKAPGYRLFYNWSDIAAIDVLTGLAEDAPLSLKVKTAAEIEAAQAKQPAASGNPPVDEIKPFLSEADLREDKVSRREARTLRRQQLQQIRARVTAPDGRRPVALWCRLLYPQANRPDRLLLYPALEERAALLHEIAVRLPRP